ncbi:MAG: DNA polymerase II [candidate division BRC1 bacterium ADurb.BinA364]|nr:MAG: DNA polymerase II [candidate division BRC1 bacterium ADurb.BinA364]
MSETPPSDYELLYGADPTPGIVAIEMQGAEAWLYRRAQNREILRLREPFQPFFLLADPALLPKSAGQACAMRKLEGIGHLKWLVEPDSWDRLWGLIGAATYAYNRRHGTTHASWRDIPDVHVVPTPEAQHLIRTGKTLFKGMEFDDLVRFQIDLETATAPGKSFPHPDDPEAAILIAALADNRGWAETIDLRERSEAELLREVVEAIRRRDPDAIEGHNILGFDLPYLMARCERHGIPFGIGRDASPPEAAPARGRLGARPIAFKDVRIHGRHVIDTLPLAQNCDPTGEIDSYSLKSLARRFGLAKRDRTYVDGAGIGEVWKRDPEKLLSYARDDAEEAAALARLLAPPVFFQAQMAPYPYQRLASLGVTARLEGIFLREHLRVGRAVPAPQPPRPGGGGYTNTFVRGLRRNVLYADVHSLYPSIILSFGIQPKSDELRVVPRTLGAILSRRLEAKRLARTAADPAERARQQAISDSFKILINSIYGYLGFGPGLWNDPAQADRVASIGRDIMRRMIQFIQESGGEPIEADTDGIYFVPPPTVETDAQCEEFVRRMSAVLPKGVEAGCEGRYKAMLSYADKNYALLTEDGETIVRGSAFRSRGLEPFLRRFLREAMGAMLRGRFEDVAQRHREMSRAILRREAPLEWFERLDRLREPLEEYQRKVAEARRGRSAAYELALRHPGRFAQGDRIAYYFAGRNVKGAEPSPKLAEEFDPQSPDYHIGHYTRRLDETLALLKPLFPENQRDLASGDAQMSFL